MAIIDINTLKGYFETGDRPTEAQFQAFIETVLKSAERFDDTAALSAAYPSGTDTTGAGGENSTTQFALVGTTTLTLYAWNGASWVSIAGGGGGGAVDSVNGFTGIVVLDADDIDDTATVNKFASAADLAAIATNSAKVSADGSISTHSDVDHTTPPSLNQVLKWNGSAYAPAADDAGSGATNLAWVAASSTVTSDTGTDATLTVVDGSNPGLMAVADKTKLDGVESGATADQTGAEIKTLYEAEANTNAFTDAEQTKLAGIETGATADMTATEIGVIVHLSGVDASKPVAGAANNGVFYLSTDISGGTLYRSNGSTWVQVAKGVTEGTGATNLAWVAASSTVTSDTGTDAVLTVVDGSNPGLMTVADKSKLDGIESGATADQTGAEIKTLYEAEANTNAFTDAEQTKLAGIETAADVTDETNVKASLNGATITGATVAASDKVLIQDTDDSNNLKTVTAQSIANLATVADTDTVVFSVLKSTAGTITAGQLVYIAGASNLVELADASVSTTLPCIGIAAGSITDAVAGNIITLGKATGLDTSTGLLGSYVYVSETTGAFTFTEPASPALSQVIGVCTKVDAATGEIFIRPGLAQAAATLSDISDWATYDPGVAETLLSQTNTVTGITNKTFTGAKETSAALTSAAAAATWAVSAGLFRKTTLTEAFTLSMSGWADGHVGLWKVTGDTVTRAVTMPAGSIDPEGTAITTLTFPATVKTTVGVDYDGTNYTFTFPATVTAA